MFVEVGLGRLVGSMSGRDGSQQDAVLILKMSRVSLGISEANFPDLVDKDAKDDLEDFGLVASVPIGETEIKLELEEVVRRNTDYDRETERNPTACKTFTRRVKANSV